MRFASAFGAAALFTAVVGGCGDEVPLKKTYMALDSQGDRQRAVFYTDTVNIFCIGELMSGRRGRTVNAVIHASKFFGQRGDYVIAVGEVPANESAAVVSFQLEKSGVGDTPAEDVPWPPGEYWCELSVDGIVAGTAGFTVEIPDCPVPPALAGGTCRGFYRKGARCKSMNQAVSCTCGESGKWEGC